MTSYEGNAIDFLKSNNIRFTVSKTEIKKCNWDNNKLHFCHTVRFLIVRLENL